MSNVALTHWTHNKNKKCTVTVWWWSAAAAAAAAGHVSSETVKLSRAALQL